MSMQAMAARRRKRFDDAVRESLRRTGLTDKRSVVVALAGRVHSSYVFDENDALLALKRAEARGLVRRVRDQEPGYPLLFERTEHGEVKWFGTLTMEPSRLESGTRCYVVYRCHEGQRERVGLVAKAARSVYRYPRSFQPWVYQREGRKRWQGEFRLRQDAARALVREMAP